MSTVSAWAYLAAFAFFVIIFLTLRDIRIFRRTRIESFRKGALKGMIAAFLALIATGITVDDPSIGLTVSLVALWINGKGKREDVFGNQPAWKRILGETQKIKN